MSDGPDEKYLRSVITSAARALRNGQPAALVASNLEDCLTWSRDPKVCQHPFWNMRQGGATYCRHCGTDTSHMDGMGR